MGLEQVRLKMQRVIRNYILLLFIFAILSSDVFAKTIRSISYSSPTWLDNETILCVKHLSYSRTWLIPFIGDLTDAPTVPIKDEIQIVSMKIDGSDEKVIKNIIKRYNPQRWDEEIFRGVNFITSISYNPQRKLIAFSTHGRLKGIFLMDEEATGIKNIAEKGNNPRFSPDGTKLLYTSNNNLYLYDLDTEETSLLVENARAGVWHPSGERIYYTFDDNPAVYSGNEKTYLLNIKDKTKELFREGWEWPVDISEDGKVLLFYPWNIYNETGETIARGYALNYPRLSPDGKKLVGSLIKDEDKGFDICVVNIDGSEKKLLR
jgi:hypothetical protein